MQMTINFNTNKKQTNQENKLIFDRSIKVFHLIIVRSDHSENQRAIHQTHTINFRMQLMQKHITLFSKYFSHFPRGTYRLSVSKKYQTTHITSHHFEIQY